MGRRTFTLPRINDALLAAIIVLNLYLILLPLAPAVLFRLHSSGPTSKQALTKKIAAGLAAPQPKQPVAATPANQLIIPSMQYDEPIVEGPTTTSLRYGPWRLPASGTPSGGGNTVIAGHRFTYTDPRGTFYYLNKVQTGDEIGVIWQGKTYRYSVASIAAVPPTDLAVEDQTRQPTLTLFTCTPLWLPKNRLVVVATLEGTS